jgi:hypothetical protein
LFAFVALRPASSPKKFALPALVAFCPALGPKNIELLAVAGLGIPASGVVEYIVEPVAAMIETTALFKAYDAVPNKEPVN